MSKWELLKSAISGKCDTNNCKDVSIHRFTGFEVIKKEKIIWKGFELHFDNSINRIGGTSNGTSSSTSSSSSSSSSIRDNDESSGSNKRNEGEEEEMKSTNYISEPHKTITPTARKNSSISSSSSSVKHGHGTNINNNSYTNNHSCNSNDIINNSSSEINDEINDHNCKIIDRNDTIDDVISTDNYRNNNMNMNDNCTNNNNSCTNSYNNCTNIFQKFMVNSYHLISEIKCVECLIIVDYIGDENSVFEISENLKKGESNKSYRVMIFENKIFLKNSSDLFNNHNDYNICQNDENVDDNPNYKGSKSIKELFHIKSQFYIKSDISDTSSMTVGQFYMYNMKLQTDILINLRNSKINDFFRIYTKEKKDDQRITKNGLLSNFINGVDNTGMII
jgi:hypothetical protein